MNFDLNLGKAASVLFLALAMAGCGGGGSTPTAMPEPEPEPVPPVDLVETQMAAKAAADAAMASSEAAAADARDAATATMNIATIQTGEMARKAATDAMKYAEMAEDEADKAASAYADAAAATTGDAAEAAWRNAVAAQEAAEAAAMTAAEKAMMAEEAAATELMIDGTMKSVGETSIDADVEASTVTTGTGDDARTVVTGLIKDDNPEATGAAVTGQAYVAAIPDDPATATDEFVKAVEYRQAAEARTFDIGKTIDSDDDMARLTLVTHYAGSETVKVYKLGTDTTSGTKAGYLSIDVTATTETETNNVALRSEGMYLQAGTGTDADLVFGDEVAAETKPAAVFSYVDPNTEAKIYVVLTNSTTVATASESTTTDTYTAVDVTALAAADSLHDTDGTPDAVQVTADIPAPVAFKHIHFGSWAGLSDAKAEDGSQSIADLGIGFVQSVGDGMTGDDMPNSGSATYNGDWVAAVRAADCARCGKYYRRGRRRNAGGGLRQGRDHRDPDGLGRTRRHH